MVVTIFIAVAAPSEDYTYGWVGVIALGLLEAAIEIYRVLIAAPLADSPKIASLSLVSSASARLRGESEAGIQAERLNGFLGWFRFVFVSCAPVENHLTLSLG